MALAALLVAVAAIVEETVFRGDLLLRLSELREGVAFPIAFPIAFPVIISSLIFALGHQYEGLAGMIVVGTMAAMWAGIYLWRGSLIAPMGIHVLQDVLAIAALGYH